MQSRHAALVALIALVLTLGHLAPAASAEDDGPRAWSSHGIKVTGAEARGQGPELVPGLYQERFDEGTDRWYRIRRVPGAMLYIAVGYAVPTGESQQLDAEVYAKDDQLCANAPNDNDSAYGAHPDTVGAGPNRLNNLIMAVQGADGAAAIEALGACGRERELYLHVKRTAGSTPADVEIQFIQQPMPDANTDLREPVQAGHEDSITAPASEQSSPVRGGGAFTDAPELTPGSYTDSIRPGEQVFYKVKVEYGQSAVATLDVPGPGGAAPDLTGQGVPPSLAVMALAPTRARVDNNAAAQLDGTPRQLSAQMPQVEFANMTNTDSFLSGVPGYHYVLVQLEQTPEGAPSEPVPFRLSVAVNGRAAPAPSWAASPEPSSTSSASPTTEDTQPVVHGSRQPYLMAVLAIAAGTGLLVGLVVLVHRLRR